MANTYTQLYIHFVFAVQNRMSLIHNNWKDELYKYITGIVQNNQHKVIAINGVTDHIHILIGYKPHQLIPELLQDIKRSSSIWINDKRLVQGRFSWQSGYGAFSYSISQISNVANYIHNQEKHHQILSFQEEYKSFLDNFGVEYNEKYLFKNIK